MAPINNTESAQGRRRELVIHFLADPMRATVDVKNPDAFQSALQKFCDDLRPWLEGRDCPLNPRAVFSLLENCIFDATGEHTAVVFSPEAEAFFRVWLRQNQVLHEGGFTTVHAWSN